MTARTVPDPNLNDDATVQRRVDLAALVLEHRPSALRLVQGAGAPREYLLVQPEVIVGREEGVGIWLDVPDLSRRHMAVRRDGDELVCQDLGSSNGVFLNGVKVHSAVLRDGDLLQLGSQVFLFQRGQS